MVLTLTTCSVHPSLHFIAQIPSTVHGEQFLAQIFRCIPSRSWLFKYGRVPMSVVLNPAVADVSYHHLYIHNMKANQTAGVCSGSLHLITLNIEGKSLS